MKFLKRLSLLCVAVSMVMNLCFVCDASGSIKYSDDSIAVTFAKETGIITEYEADKTVTVGELAEAVSFVFGGTYLAERYFSSVDKAKESTLTEAVCVFVDMAGYGKYAEAKFGDNSVNSFFLTAENIGLLSGVSRDRNAMLKQSDLVNLVYNILEVKILDYTYSQNGGLSFEETDRLYMNNVLDMYALTGIVDSTTYSSINSEKGTGDNTIVIDGIAYKCEKGKYEDFVGHRVKAFIRNNDGTAEIAALADKSTAIEINAEDIDKVSTGKYNITYFNASDRAINIQLDPRVDILYNYKLYMGHTADDFKINQGRLVLVDNDSDGKYEVVKIEEYKSFMIYSVSKSSQNAVDMFGNVYSLKTMMDEDYPAYDEGTLTTVDNLPVGKVASVFENRDGEIVRIYTTLNKTALKISSFNLKKNEIKTDEKTFRYTDEIKSDIERYKTGDLLTVWLDMYGNIAHFEVSEDAYLYGYMVSFTEGSGFEQPKVKMYTEDDKMVVFTTKNRINLNGSTMLATEAFSKDNNSSGLWDAVGKINQIVKYKANKDNVISAIMTSTKYDTGQTDRPLKVLDGNYRYFSKPSMITSKVRLSPYTKVFFVPETLSKTERYRYGNKSIMSGDTLYTCQIFDVDENQYAGAIMCRVSDTGKGQIDQISAPVYVISEVGRMINDLGEESVFVNAYNTDDKIKEIRFNDINLSATLQSNTVTVADLMRGDIIQIAEDVNNTMESSNMVVRYLNGRTTPYESAAAHWYAYADADTFCSDGYAYCAGVIKRFVKNGVVINNKPDDTENWDKWDRVITTKSNTPVYICDNARETVTLGTVADLKVGDKVFSLLRESEPNKFVVYRD